jgi:hypothetical protein
MKLNKTIKKIFIHSFIFTILSLPMISYAEGLVPCDGLDCNYDHFIELIIGIIKFSIQLGIAFSAIIFAWAGWLYMTSGGDSAKIKQAHGLFVKVLWGFLFALGAFLIVELIANSLGLKAGIVNI